MPKGEEAVDDGRRETAVGGLGDRLFGGEEGVAYWKWARVLWLWVVWKELGEALGDLAGTGERVNIVSAPWLVWEHFKQK